MPPRSLLSASTRADLFDIPTDFDDLVRHYLLSPSDLELIRTRRRNENRFGLAVHVSLLRHSGKGWCDGMVLPAPFLEWLGDQLHLSPSVGQTRLTWLRGFPHSASSASMMALLDRLKYLRSLDRPSDLGQDLHPDRMIKFAREGAVAPVSLLNDFGERRGIARLRRRWQIYPSRPPTRPLPCLSA